MPLVETLPLGDGCAQWNVWGTVARIVVTDPRHLHAATALVQAELAAVDAACSRFRPDTELEDVYRARGYPVRVSDRLAHLVAAAVHAAADTDGDVDPTLGAALAALGYDRDFSVLAATDSRRIAIVRPVDWREIRLDGNLLTVPAGARMDLGATAKAWAADRCAALVADTCDTGVLIALGGDIATAGPATGGWDILVQDGPDQPTCTVNLPARAAIATSSTISRNWRQGTQTFHHILSPRTGYPATRTWRTASVVAHTCVAANTMSTAAIIRGDRARAWLHERDAAARLVTADGAIITCGGWPNERTDR
jgi:FAD:protein FMN transferase